MAIDYSAVRWILCDLGKTLVNFEHRIAGERLLEYLDSHRAPSHEAITAGRLFDFFFGAESGRGTRNQTMERGERDIDWLAEEIGARFGVPIDKGLLDRFWNDIFLGTNPAVIAAMQTARARGVHVAICSNTTRSHWEFVLRTYPEIRSLYETAFLSFQMGTTKTEPGFFESILRETGCPARAHLFIDDMQENLDAAARTGIQTLLYRENLPASPLW